MIYLNNNLLRISLCGNDLDGGRVIGVEASDGLEGSPQNVPVHLDVPGLVVGSLNKKCGELHSKLHS
jgi:hypothetical protein